MHHETELITTLAAAFGLALIFGLVASRLRLPPLVGYLLAGVAVGPFTPGFTADSGMASQLSEIGVILLMFGVGLHFSVRDLLAVKNISLPGAVAQIGTATIIGAIFVKTWGWTWGQGLVFGLSLSVASTVVLLRALESRGLTTTIDGRIAVGWLIVEDLAMVLALVLLPSLAIPLGGTSSGEGGNLLWNLTTTMLKVVAFAALMYVVGRRAVPALLGRVAATASRELFTLALLAVALGIAVGASELFDVSFALAAFFAGVVISESDLSHRASADALPFQDAFAVLFFVSVGMLFDPDVILNEPFQVLTVFLIITVVKSIAAFVIVLMFRYPLSTALKVAASLAQIGEFSFILVAVGTSLSILPSDAESLVLAGALLSITVNPIIFETIDPIDRWFRRHPRLASLLERPGGKLSELPEEVRERELHDHVVLVGHGGVGTPVAEALAAMGVPYIVVEQNREIAQELRESGVQAIYGDAARPGILDHAHLERARLLVVSVGDALDARIILEHARKMNPDIDTVVRTHSESERRQLEKLEISRTVVAERELALAVIRYTSDVFDTTPAHP